MPQSPPNHCELGSIEEAEVKGKSAFRSVALDIPISAVKINRSFIAEVSANSGDGWVQPRV
jgi:hypothetical protein